MHEWAKSMVWLGVVCVGVAWAAPVVQGQTRRLKAVPFVAVDVRSAFWTTRQRVNAEKTIPHLIAMCEREGRVRNLARAAGKLDGDFEGTRYHDADLFKVIEAASYVLALDPNPQLDRKLDELIAAVSEAQRDDGYLHTYAQVRSRGTKPPTKLNLFASGHLIHAGAAHFEATGKRSLLRVAVRMADLIRSQYGPGRRIDVPSHPILETALFRLAGVTENEGYAELARFFINERGRADRSGRRSYGVHGADAVPVRDLRDAEGHVIVTLFLLSGMVDAGVRLGDRELLAPCRRLFDDAVTRRMYVTGAMGRQSDERFTDPYALDNRTSLGEGCQSAALVRFAQRLLLLDADARYADVIERVMYNNLAANVGLDGTTFFYYNRLSARPEDAGGRPYTGVVRETDRARMPRNCLKRQPWFKVPCCPPNVAMTVATIGQYAYATSEDSVYVSQYLESTAAMSVGATRLCVEQKTRYPWEGQIALTLAPEKSPWRGAVCLRIPDWCRSLESTGGLYRPRRAGSDEPWTVRINGRSIEPGALDRGYLVLRRDWEKGDLVELDLPMPVVRLTSHPNVDADRGRVALGRGPIVYCIEAVDHAGQIRGVYLPPESALHAEHRPDFLGGVTVLEGEARRQRNAGAAQGPVRLLAVPYAVWANREVGDMDVWLREAPKEEREEERGHSTLSPKNQNVPFFPLFPQPFIRDVPFSTRKIAMKRLAVVAVVTSLLLSASFLRAEARAGEERSRPNIILILADDLGYGDLGCYGQKQIQTPVLDRMAEEGLRFTHFYAGASLCLPSRCTLMTGLHTGHCRCRVNGGGGSHPPIAEADTTLATVLKAAGYRTGMVGKWALGDHYLGCVVDRQNTDGPGALYRHGWDYYFGEPNQTYNHRYYPPQLYRYDPNGWIGDKTQGRRLDVVPLENDASGKRGKQYSHDLLAENALAFIRAAGDQPFFLYVPFTIPHADFIVPELEPYVRDRPWPDRAKVFASMISRMDRDVGRIVRLLEDRKIDKRTLVVFTSDNGGLPAHDETFQNNGDLPGYKGTLTEGGLRVPCIARWPGRIRAGRASDEPLAFWDFMPTFAELAGIEPPAPIDGVSFVPTLLESGEQESHRYLFFRSSDRKKRCYVVRGKDESRSDDEIFAEANTEVVVPKFGGSQR